MQPFVSCLLATADRPGLAQQAIRYFLRQDYAQSELVILDDGARQIRDILPSDDRLRYVRLDRRLTLGAKHNLGCELARGDVMLHWDDDDWMAPWRISYQVCEWLRTPDRVTGLSHLRYFDPVKALAWEYVYDMEKPWIGGGTFCYSKDFWRSHRFPDMNEGVDTVFVWDLPPDHVLAIPDNRFYVATVHSRNTSPKATTGSNWRPQPIDSIRELVGDDWSFYERFAIAAEHEESP